MAAKIYRVYNCSRPSSAGPVSQPTATSTTVRTMLQIAMGTGFIGRIVEWGISFDGFSAVLPAKVELFSCTGAATMSTSAAVGDIMPLNDQYAFVATTSIPFDFNTGTSLTGFATGAVTEGTVANYRSFDMQLLPPTGPYVKQWPLGREPEVNRFHTDGSTQCFVRVRLTTNASVNVYIYVDVEV